MKYPFKNIFRFKKTILIIAIILIICTIAPFVIFDSSAFSLASSSGNEAFWLWTFLGRLHPMAVHFPVTLLLFAAILEVVTLKNFNSKLRPALNLMVYAGAASAIVSVVFGLLLANGEDYGGDNLPIHQWTGIGTALFGIVAAYFLFRIEKKKHWKLVKAYRGILLFTAIGVSVAGHFGAYLTHGNDYLSSVIPGMDDYREPESRSENKFDLVALKTTDTAPLTEEQQLQINGEVRAIFAHNCYSCHSSAKVKGGLRLDKKRLAFNGGDSGLVIIPGDPKGSELMRRITLPRNHKEAMPSKGKKLSDDEIATIRFWIEKGAPWPDAADQKSIFRVAKLEPRMPALPVASGDLGNPIDLWVNDYFIKKKIIWPSVVDDKTYLRRIYLDIIGLLPSPEEQETFIKDSRPDKRSIYVRELLNREDDYAMHWLTFWNDALRNDYTGTGYITGGRFNITDWLYKSLKSNKPYDQFVKELISPAEESKGFIKGIQWRGVINSSQSTEMQAAQNVAQVFLGLNLKCASCHDSFISDWKLEDAYSFANIFSDTTLEINRCDVPTGKFAGTKMLWPELGGIDSSAKAVEKLKQLAENLTKPANGRLYRTIVNRIWAQMMGRGIVEPVDVMDNEPWSQDLLDWLASDFVASKHDLKELIYLITTSKTYQLPSVGMKDANRLTAQDFEFKGMVRKRMFAEQFSDVVSKVIEPIFPDSVMKYDPLKKLGFERPYQLFTRASLVGNNSFLTALGRPNRETVSTSRESRANLLQALELTNGNRLNEVLEKRR